MLPHDWLTGRILKQGNGFERWTTDRGDASGTGYWSAGSDDYRLDLLKTAFGRELEVPARAGAVRGRRAHRCRDARRRRNGRQHGRGPRADPRPGDVVVSLGTSGTVFTPHDSAIRDETGAIAGFADATGRHLPLMCTLNAARVLGAVATMIGVDLAELDRLALAADPGAGGLTLLPYLDGERTPDLPDATGTLSGLTRSNATPENLARAAVEGMLCNLVGGVDALRRHGVDVERVLLIGGAAASRAVREIAPGLFRAPVVVPAPGEYVGIGAARQAAWALSGDATPPTWPLALDSEYAVPTGQGSAAADVVARYQSLVTSTHGSEPEAAPPRLARRSRPILRTVQPRLDRAGPHAPRARHHPGVVTSSSALRQVSDRQASALALSAANSSAVMAPESSSSLALAICSGAEVLEPATERT